jgi:outer membrane protein OmpA-like peptidoglycan-associated protein
VEFKGFTLTFGTGIMPMDRGNVIASLGSALQIQELPDPDTLVQSAPPPPASVAVAPISEAEDLPSPSALSNVDLQDSAIDLIPVPEGIRLTIRDIRFAPDSAEFLPVERARLDLIADALSQVPERLCLVEGHTASTGRPAGEMDLSVQRAMRMVEELVSRGISENRFIYKGSGGTKPIGDNSTPEGRSLNRRVEITILE